MFSPRLSGCLARTESRMLTGILTFCSQHHCPIQCGLQFECQGRKTLCLSLFSSPSASTGSLVSYKTHGVRGRRILSLKLLERFKIFCGSQRVNCESECKAVTPADD